MTFVDTKIPAKIDLGSMANSTMAHCMGNKNSYDRGEVANPFGYRVVMGFFLPPWQRGLVWSQEQKASFIKSAWLGMPIGSYSYNMADYGHPLDNLLIDGQQRMSAIEDYITDKLEVFGVLFSELPAADKRRWSMVTTFPSYRCETTDEQYLKDYYNLMNFGGVSHKETERA